MGDLNAKDDLKKSMKACLKNAERLLDEAQALEFEKPLSSRFFLSMIAQEECSKGFLLSLVSMNLIPWDDVIFRATKNHECKQLLGLVIEFLNPSWDDFEIRMNDWKEKIEKGILQDLPDHVVDAINVFRYKKIEKWRGKNWFWV
jgi:AbiV family abortive infection protein